MNIETLNIQNLATELIMEDDYNGVTLMWYPNTMTLVTATESYGEPIQVKTQSFSSVEEAQGVIVGWTQSLAFGFELI